MLKHIVLFKFKDTANGKTKAENLEAARARMLALKEEIPEIVDLEVYFGAPRLRPGKLRLHPGVHLPEYGGDAPLPEPPQPCGLRPVCERAAGA